MKYIVTSDLHLRPDMPICRKDPDWMETQRDVLRQLVKYSYEFDAELLICGDIFDVPNVPSSVVSMFIQEMMPLRSHGNRHIASIIAGNHSLPWHKQENLYSSSIGIIASLFGEDFPISYNDCEDNTKDGIFEHAAEIARGPSIYMVHTLTFKSPDDIPFGAKGYCASQLLDKYPDAKFIFTGDNHTAFVYEDDGRYVINPGSPIIQSASAIDYKPVCYYVDTEKKEIKELPMPNDPDMLTRDHLEEKHQRDDRISAFVEKVKNNGKVSLSFFDNLARTLEDTRVPEEVKMILDELRMEVGVES